MTVIASIIESVVPGANEQRLWGCVFVQLPAPGDRIKVVREDGLTEFRVLYTVHDPVIREPESERNATPSAEVVVEVIRKYR